MKWLMLTSSAMMMAGCAPEGGQQGGNTSANSKVATSGKSEVPLAEVPSDVLNVARAAAPGFTAKEAEAELRDGRRYFDIEGTLSDGSEVEFDIMEEAGRWRVVETQRDISFAAAPAAVREANNERDPAFKPSRVIESRQSDGVTIYELYGPAPGDPQGTKVEIKWDGRAAEILQKEWAH